jgi:polyhydroxyalkanoate synthesis regulator phasin
MSEKDWQLSEADRDNRFYRNKQDTEYIDGLRAEVERLTRDLDEWKVKRTMTAAMDQEHARVIAENHELRAEVERLRRENDSLYDMLQSMQINLKRLLDGRPHRA